MPELSGAGHAVGALSRHAAPGRSGGIEHREVDVGKPEELREAREGAEAAYYEVHSLGGSGDYLTERLPATVCPKWVRTRIEPEEISDAIAYPVRALDAPPGNAAEAARDLARIGGDLARCG